MVPEDHCGGSIAVAGANDQSAPNTDTSIIRCHPIVHSPPSPPITGRCGPPFGGKQLRGSGPGPACRTPTSRGTSGRPLRPPSSPATRRSGRRRRPTAPTPAARPSGQQRTGTLPPGRHEEDAFRLRAPPQEVLEGRSALGRRQPRPGHGFEHKSRSDHQDDQRPATAGLAVGGSHADIISPTPKAQAVQVAGAATSPHPWTVSMMRNEPSATAPGQGNEKGT
jgi:hypothetical protein